MVVLDEECREAESTLRSTLTMVVLRMMVGIQISMRTITTIRSVRLARNKDQDPLRAGLRSHKYVAQHFSDHFGIVLTLSQAWGLQQTQPQMPMMPDLSGMGMPSMPSMRNDYLSDPDEELIPTAIVIKNIPFAVKKEQLVQLMTDMRLPLPYAFNYHFDNGVFRGLAFANFTTPEETHMVIDSLNQIELQGRKLRVEYKKMLPAAERERIEREKRERRGQLQSQHEQAGMGGGLHQQPSLQSISSSHVPNPSPSPVSARNNGMKLGTSTVYASSSDDASLIMSGCDLNDPQVLKYYSQLLLFKEDLARDTMTFPPALTPHERRTVHTLAHHMNLAHVAKGLGDQRQVHVFRVHDMPQNMSPPIQQMPHDPNRRALNRAATTDFSDVRGHDGYAGTLGRQHSGFLLSEPGGLSTHPNLRAAKSYADLRSYTPSPAQSTASYPANLNTNLSRYDMGFQSGPSTNPSLTPTTSMPNREETMLVNGLGGMTLGSGFGAGGSPRGMRQAWERDTPGPIGGHRSFSNFDDARSGNMPPRQPRGHMGDRGAGFTSNARRANGHHGRGSDDNSSHSGVSGVEIVVE